MPFALEQLLGTEVIVKVISRIATPQSRLQRFLGMGIGGTNTMQVPGKSFAWDIFDRTRTIAQGRAPGTGPATVSPQAIGNVTARAYRSHEKVPLLHERIFRNRPLGGSFGEVDTNGARYISKQELHLAQRFKNSRELLIALLLVDGRLGIKIDGDNQIPVKVGGGEHFVIDYKVPASNQGNCGGIFAGDWGTNAAADVHGELLKLNKQSARAAGFPISHAWINSTTWGKLLSRNQVRDLAGTSNMPFAQYDRVAGEGEGGEGNRGNTEFVGQLRGIPWITWHIYDEVLDIDGATTQIIPDAKAIFMPDPSSAWIEMMEGSEIVKRNVMEQGEEMYGFSAWPTDVIDPAAIDLKALDICLPALYIPNAIYSATVG